MDGKGEVQVSCQSAATVSGGAVGLHQRALKPSLIDLLLLSSTETTVGGWPPRTGLGAARHVLPFQVPTSEVDSIQEGQIT